MYALRSRMHIYSAFANAINRVLAVYVYLRMIYERETDGVCGVCRLIERFSMYIVFVCFGKMFSRVYSIPREYYSLNLMIISSFYQNFDTRID